MRSEATNLRVLTPCEVEICFANFNFNFEKIEITSRGKIPLVNRASLMARVLGASFYGL